LPPGKLIDNGLHLATDSSQSESHTSGVEQTNIPHTSSDIDTGNVSKVVEPITPSASNNHSQSASEDSPLTHISSSESEHSDTNEPDLQVGSTKQAFDAQPATDSSATQPMVNHKVVERITHGKLDPRTNQKLYYVTYKGRHKGEWIKYSQLPPALQKQVTEIPPLMLRGKRVKVHF
jgi:hypothetical protein